MSKHRLSAAVARKYPEIMRLHQQGFSARAIANIMLVSRATVGTLLTSKVFRRGVDVDDPLEVSKFGYSEKDEEEESRVVAPYKCTGCHNTVIFSPCEICKARRYHDKKF